MKIAVYPIVLIIFILSASSCYYDNASLLYGNAGTTCTNPMSNVSYSQYVAPILTQYCYSCHTGNMPSGGVLMGTYAQDKALAQNGKLYGCINYSPGYLPMPQGMPKLTACQIANIKTWIDSGMPTN